MSYLDRKHTNHRTATIIAVSVIEAAAIFAVVRGLTVHFNPPETIPNPQATEIPVTLPTPIPTEKPVIRPHPDSGRPIHDTVVPPLTDPLVVPVPQPTGTIVPIPQPTPIAVIEPPRPQFTPRAARPVGRPSAWVTSNDYPARDLREGNAGVTGFLLSIGSDGRVLACTVTATSGYPGLDRATCDNLTRRARFEPAIDGSGAKVAGTYSNNIRWVIPE